MAPGMDELPPYQYRPLRDGEIRVLYLKSGSPEHAIECVLRHGITKSIHESPDFFGGSDGRQPFGGRPPSFPPRLPLEDQVPRLRYGALSYAPGTTYADGSHFTHKIVCEGKVLRVTAALHAFLRRARRDISSDWPHPPPLELPSLYDYGPPCVYPISIDAICINQSDPVEQSKQVRMMPRIYSNALTFLVWLGDISDDEKAALSKAIEDKNSSTLSRGYTEAQSRAIPQLLKRHWFQRRWNTRIVNKADVGSTSATSKFEDEILNSSPVRVDTHQRSSIPPVPTGDKNFLWRTLLWNLHVYDKAKCSDPRDLVYALVHISSDLRSTTFGVDYSKTITRVFRDAAESAPIAASAPTHPGGPDCETSDAIGLLALATTRLHYRDTAEKLPHSPSWVPDWRAPILYICPEHQSAIQSMLASYTGPRSPLAVATVVGDALIMKGDVVQPCFPFHHRKRAAGMTTCRCCQLFNNKWPEWSEELKWNLGVGRHSGELLFVPRTVRSPRVPKFPPNNGVAFVVRESGTDYEVRYCFRFPHSQSFEPEDEKTICII